jgi:dihydrodipicolinate synthase/N-acetylneuraminate lyase
MPMVAAVKEVMAVRHGRDSFRTVIPPLMELNEAQRRTLHDALKGIVL